MRWKVTRLHLEHMPLGTLGCVHPVPKKTEPQSTCQWQLPWNTCPMAPCFHYFLNNKTVRAGQSQASLTYWGCSQQRVTLAPWPDKDDVLHSHRLWINRNSSSGAQSLGLLLLRPKSISTEELKGVWILSQDKSILLSYFWETLKALRLSYI